MNSKKDNLIIYLSCRNNYDMLEGEVIRNIDTEGFEMFAVMIETVKHKTLSTLFKIKIASEEEVDREALEKRKRQQSEMRLSRGGGEGSGEAQQQPMKREGEKIGRNAPCPCGSGKKYKKCHGRLK